MLWFMVLGEGQPTAAMCMRKSCLSQRHPFPSPRPALSAQLNHWQANALLLLILSHTAQTLPVRVAEGAACHVWADLGWAPLGEVGPRGTSQAVKTNR